MKREIIKTLALIAILVTVAGIASIQVGKAAQTLTVPEQYPTIGAAVNAASAGDTIFVESGVYRENVQITKSLTLEGQSSANTTIIGSGGSTPKAVLVLAADNVKVSGFTVESLNYTAADHVCVRHLG